MKLIAICGTFVLIALLPSCARAPEEVSPTAAHTLAVDDNAIIAVGFSGDGETLYSANSLGVIRAWDVRTALPVGTIPTQAAFLAFSPNGDRALVGNRNLVKVVDLARRRVSESMEVGIDSAALFVRSAYISADSSTAVLIHSGGSVSVWNVAERRERHGFLTTVSIGYALDVAAYSPTGSKILLASSKAPTIEIRDVQSGDVLQRLSAHERGLRTAAFSIAGTEMATVGVDNSFKRWNAESGELLATYDTSAAPVIEQIAFWRRGTLIVTGHIDGSIMFWDVNAGSLARRFKAHDGWVETMAISPDGRHLASGGPDGKVRLWRFTEALTDQPDPSPAAKAHGVRSCIHAICMETIGDTVFPLRVGVGRLSLFGRTMGSGLAFMHCLRAVGVGVDAVAAR